MVRVRHRMELRSELDDCIGPRQVALQNLQRPKRCAEGRERQRQAFRVRSADAAVAGLGTAERYHAKRSSRCDQWPCEEPTGSSGGRARSICWVTPVPGRRDCGLWGASPSAWRRSSFGGRHLVPHFLRKVEDDNGLLAVVHRLEHHEPLAIRRNVVVGVERVSGVYVREQRVARSHRE